MGRNIQATPEITRRAIQMRADHKTWAEIVSTLGVGTTTIQCACRAVGKAEPRVAQLLHRVGREMLSRAGQKTKALHHENDEAPIVRECQSFIYAPDPETYDQKLTGTPPLARSALNEFETDGRGNVSKRQPTVSFGAISIPDIRINNHSN